MDSSLLVSIEQIYLRDDYPNHLCLVPSSPAMGRLIYLWKLTDAVPFQVSHRVPEAYQVVGEKFPEDSHVTLRDSSCRQTNWLHDPQSAETKKDPSNQATEQFGLLTVPHLSHLELLKGYHQYVET